MFSYFQIEMAPWLLLILSIILIFLRNRFWPGSLALTLLIGGFYQSLDWLGLILILLGLLSAFAIRRFDDWRAKILTFFVVIWALALATHQVPGINNLLVLDQVTSGPQSTVFSLYLNLDKPMLIFAFLMFIPKMLSLTATPHLHANRLLPLASAGLLIIPFIAWWGGIIQPELSLPQWFLIFALNNLFLTCVAEEVFFRGFLFHLLLRYGNSTALITSSLLFGIAHYAAGGLFVILATFAGLCYGLIYQATGKLYWAILAHFLFNIYHLLFFTYPLLN